MANEKEYQDEYFCEVCDKDTTQTVTPRSTEREDRDIFKCTECFHSKIGMLGEWNLPDNTE